MRTPYAERWAHLSDSWQHALRIARGDEEFANDIMLDWADDAREAAEQEEWGYDDEG